ncbi:MAG: hypothetical protein ABIT96_05565 [Ferruginibacter sp.]
MLYNGSLQAKFMIITNGSHCMAFERNEQNFAPVNEIPVMEE